jgi:hypothetical protein
MDAVWTLQRIDRRPFLVEECQFVNVSFGQPPLDGV